MKTSPARAKITNLATLRASVARARRRGERIVFTNGCFDLLHPGHVRSLEAAARLGDRLIVAVNDDASIRRAKGPDRPIQNARSRRELVAALACVDWVVGFRSDTPIALIRALRPDILTKGGDWALAEIVGREDVESWGGRVVRLAIVPGERSTDLIARIQRTTPRRKH
jgi:D-beta-D-heptose 7-phosphate kinase/D-beta-D-heptose 1-phosphate adenosyltransferase